MPMYSSLVIVALVLPGVYGCVEAEQRSRSTAAIRDFERLELNSREVWVALDRLDLPTIVLVDDLLESPDLTSDPASDLSSDLSSDLAPDMAPDLATSDLLADAVDTAPLEDVGPADLSGPDTTAPTCIANDSCSGDCALGCSSDCTCALDCQDNEGTCDVKCSAESVCAVDCRGANNCEVDCKDQSRCTIDCRDANNCKPLRCKDDSYCEIDCRGADNCDDFKCEHRAQCYLRCDSDQDCGCRGATSCGDGLIACNGAPCR